MCTIYQTPPSQKTINKCVTTIRTLISVHTFLNDCNFSFDYRPLYENSFSRYFGPMTKNIRIFFFAAMGLITWRIMLDIYPIMWGSRCMCVRVANGRRYMNVCGRFGRRNGSLTLKWNTSNSFMICVLATGYPRTYIEAEAQQPLGIIGKICRRLLINEQMFHHL